MIVPFILFLFVRMRTRVCVSVYLKGVFFWADQALGKGHKGGDYDCGCISYPVLCNTLPPDVQAYKQPMSVGEEFGNSGWVLLA